jgi:hypothetical protein
MPALAQQEPPARVGRVGYASGDLSFRVAGDKEWSEAGVNYPVATGGSFWVDPQGRAEIAVGTDTVDLAGGTELDIVELDERATQLGLPQGRVFVRLRQLARGQSVEIDLPQGGVWLLQPGAYDIDAGAADRPGRVQVFEGSARFAGGGADQEIRAGDAAVLSGANPVAAALQPAAADEFVEWCRSRDAERSRVAAPRHVSPQMTGYAELDPYGQWRSSPQYGEVWYPNQVPTGWAPYRDGRWISVPPWGWTWVDDQPWGFAPSHYGRWAYIDDRWGWVPGRIVPQPVYAPALVAFVSAPAIAVGVAAAAGPAVGWFPLGPGEVYWPSYTRNTYYIRNVNVTNVRNIDTVVVRSRGVPPPRLAHAAFANRRFATVVPQRVFADAGKIAPAAIHVPPARLRNAAVSVQPPRVAPARRPARAPRPPLDERRRPEASRDQAVSPAPGARPRATEDVAGRSPGAAQPAVARPSGGPGPSRRPNDADRGNGSSPSKGKSADRDAAVPSDERRPDGARETPDATPSRRGADRGAPPAVTAPRPAAEANRSETPSKEQPRSGPREAPQSHVSPGRSAAPRAPAVAQRPSLRPEARDRPVAPAPHRPAAIAPEAHPNRPAQARAPGPVQSQPPAQSRAPRAPEPVHSAAPRAPARAAPAHAPSAPPARAAPQAHAPSRPAAPRAVAPRPTAPRAAPAQPQPHPQAASKPAAQAVHKASKKSDGDKSK